MRISTEPADTAWAETEPLLLSVWPPDLDPPPPWAHIVITQYPTSRVMVRSESGELLCHVGLQIRTALWEGRSVRIGGIGGVATHAEHRRNGYASRAIDMALQELSKPGFDFALLFAEPHNFNFYERRGWHKFAGDVFIEQPQGRIKHEVVTPFVYDNAIAPRTGTIDLLGTPW